MDINYSLYVVTDRTLMTSDTVENAAYQAVLGGAGLIQLREKNISALEFYNTALKVKDALKGTGTPLIINDRADIAMAADADGVHIGQNDLPVNTVRKLMGKNKIIGVSAATVEEAVKAEMEGADYIGSGAMFVTQTKNNTRALSFETLKDIVRAVNIPVVAIGGINADNILSLKGSGIKGVAVVSAVIAQRNIREASEMMYSLSKKMQGID